jgi:hypothetical protein
MTLPVVMRAIILMQPDRAHELAEAGAERPIQQLA